MAQTWYEIVFNMRASGLCAIWNTNPIATLDHNSQVHPECFPIAIKKFQGDSVLAGEARDMGQQWAKIHDKRFLPRTMIHFCREENLPDILQTGLCSGALLATAGVTRGGRRRGRQEFLTGTGRCFIHFKCLPLCKAKPGRDGLSKTNRPA